ncbi:C-X-C motif chemokine 19 [Aplochiton taeniatus]
MKFCLLLSLLVTIFIVNTNGMPPIGRDYNRRCLCLHLESRIIPPDSLKSIEIIPKNPHCQSTEVIAGLATGERVCLNPSSSWVKKLTHFISQRQSHLG